MTNEEIREVVESIFKNHFGDVDVLAINVRPDLDHDGDPVVRVKIVYDGKGELLSSPGTLYVREEVWMELASDPEQEVGFPILSFIEKSDLGKRSPEAA